MTSRAWIDPRVSQVTVAQVRAYLTAHGWRLRAPTRPQLLVFEGPLSDEGDPLVLILPSSEMMDDYRMRVEDLVGALGIIENRTAVEILNEILQPKPLNGVLPREPVNGVTAEN